MKWMRWIGMPVLSSVLGCGWVLAQAPTSSQGTESAPTTAVAMTPEDAGPVPLEWVPPALARLSAQAAVKSNFTLDHDMLAAAAGLVPDSDAPTRQAIGKLRGVSVHTMRFGEAGMANPTDVESIRAAYHLRGWKHVVSAGNSGGPVHDGTTDVWVVMDGANLRGAVVLAETPKSLTLVTVAGNLSPVDLLHLRGHFGIPRFDGDGLTDAK
jgi:hypothetical protein